MSQGLLCKLGQHSENLSEKKREGEGGRGRRKEEGGKKGRKETKYLSELVLLLLLFLGIEPRACTLALSCTPAPWFVV